MSIKVLSFNDAAPADVPEFTNPIRGYSFVSERFDVLDGAGGRMLPGVASDGSRTLTYIDASGAQAVATDVLPASANFLQGDAIPFGDESAFLVVYGDDAVGLYGSAALGVATLASDGTPTFTSLPDDVIPSEPGLQQYDIELTALSDGRIGVVSTSYDENDGHVVFNVGVVSGTSGAPEYTELDTVLDAVTLEASILALPDGGTLMVGNVVDQDGESPYEDIQIQQFAADGTLVAADVLTVEQMNGLGFDSSEVEITFDLTDDGELAAYLSEFDSADVVQVMFDLIPEQTDVPGVDLPALPEGEYFDGELDGSTLVGTAGSDYFSMYNGDDVVFGGGGFDYMSLEGGDDTAYGGDGEDYLDGGKGKDVLYAGAGDDDAYGGRSADDVRGAAGDDGVYGDEGNDFLRGNHDDDDMHGGAGHDDMNGGYGDDTVSGDSGDDKVSGYDGDDTLYGGDGVDAMHGGRGDDAMFGGAGDDVMRGADGDDTLTGDAGDDLLIGGEGADVYAFDLFEEQYSQTIDFDDEGPGGDVLFLDDPVAQGNGTDTIKGFTVGEDKIALDGSYEVIDDQDPLATNTVSDLTFDDIFLSQEDSAAVIQAGETTIRLENVDADDLTESDFILL